MSSFQLEDSSSTAPTITVAASSNSTTGTPCTEKASWRQRMRQIHQNADPELVDSIRKRAERRQFMDSSLQQSSLLQRSLKVSVASFSSPVTARASNMSAPMHGHRAVPTTFGVSSAPAPRTSFAPSTTSFGFSAPPPTESATEDWESAAEQSSAVHSRLRSVLSCQRGGNAVSLAQATAELEEVERDLGTEPEGNEETGITAILKLLEVEPSDDKELAAKFALYENFLESVVLIREETLRFWDENQDLFEGHAKEAGQSAIKQIDSTDCMFIQVEDPFRAMKWFVHSMCAKAHKNSEKISNVLSVLRTRIELLRRDLEDCPFCLDTLAEREVVTLGCCHRTCKDCWENWVQIKGHGEAFCPLCKHVQFLEDIVATDDA